MITIRIITNTVLKTSLAQETYNITIQWTIEFYVAI